MGKALAQTLAGIFLAFVGLAACSTEANETSPTDTAPQVTGGATDPPTDTTTNPSLDSANVSEATFEAGALMTAVPRSPKAGEQISMFFRGSLADGRGGFYRLEDNSRQLVAGMWSNTGEFDKPGFTLDIDAFVILDYAVFGPGPDQLLLPVEVAPGDYQLCTANSRPETCLPITIE